MDTNTSSLLISHLLRNASRSAIRLLLGGIVAAFAAGSAMSQPLQGAGVEFTPTRCQLKIGKLKSNQCSWGSLSSWSSHGVSYQGLFLLIGETGIFQVFVQGEMGSPNKIVASTFMRTNPEAFKDGRLYRPSREVHLAPDLNGKCSAISPKSQQVTCSGKLANGDPVFITVSVTNPTSTPRESRAETAMNPALYGIETGNPMEIIRLQEQFDRGLMAFSEGGGYPRERAAIQSIIDYANECRLSRAVAFHSPFRLENSDLEGNGSLNIPRGGYPSGSRPTRSSKGIPCDPEASALLTAITSSPYLPESRRLGLFVDTDSKLAPIFQAAMQSRAAAEKALYYRLNRQGRLQDIKRQQMIYLRTSSHKDSVRAYEEILSSLTNQDLSYEERKVLEFKRNDIERSLYFDLPFRAPEFVGVNSIRSALPKEGVLLEFQRYRPWVSASQSWGQAQYLALLLSSDGIVRAIPLGEAAPIDAAVAEALAASADRNQQAEASKKLAAVSRLVLAPLQGELAGVRELFLSPDGELNRLPFAALPLSAADGPTLGDTLSLRLLTTGRELLRLQQPAKVGRPPVLIANPDFNASARPAAAGLATAGPAAVRQQRSPGVRGLNAWQPLTGTEQEARALAPLLGGGLVISGPAATSRAVLAQRAPRILHIATHGFFLADQPTAPGSARGASSFAAVAPARIGNQEDPLQRSGLVFAGANRPEADPADDGYLTAAEATAMDLDGTELVTLSACETGVGGVRSGEGVYGLQRSLAVAGARSTLLSLWKVDDGLTATFMERFYNRLRAGEGRADALRSTQAEFRNHKNSTYNDIRVWGAFQLSGDWRPLPKW